MIHVVPFARVGEYASEMYQMHCLRYEVFHKRLGWEVTVSGELEFDEYDTQNPLYLLSTGDDGQVHGCVRFLPTLSSYMLQDTFPVLAGQHEVPKSPFIWEASRFAVARSDRCANGHSLSTPTHELLAAAIELGLAEGLTDIVAVVDLRMERILRIAGWPLRRFDAPQQIGVTRAVAGLLNVSESTCSEICRRGGISTPVLSLPVTRLAA